MNEASWLKYLQKRFNFESSEKNLFGIGDDAAIFPYSKEFSYILTKDLFIENVHFTFDFFDFKQLGYKSLAVNISDIAAMGGYPKYLFVAFAFPETTPKSNFHEFYKGLEILMKRYNIILLGGDSSKSSKSHFISISLIGIVSNSKVLIYPKTKINDYIYITGDLGSAHLAFQFLKYKKVDAIKGYYPKLLKDYQKPPLRIHLMQRLIKSYTINSAIDLSDGLASALYKMFFNYGLGVEIEWSKIPKSHFLENRNLKAILNKLGLEDKERNRLKKNCILYGGEDYEILFTSKDNIKTKQLNKQYKSNIKRIGIVTNIKAINLKIDNKIKKIKRIEFKHF